MTMLDELDGGAERRRAHDAAAAGRSAWEDGDVETAMRWFELDLEISRRLVADRPDWVADLTASLANVGNAAYASGEVEVAREAFEEALALCRGAVACDDPPRDALRDLSGALGDLGRLMRARSAYREAATLFEEDLDLCRALLALEDCDAHRRWVAVALNQVAAEARRAGDVARARLLYTESAARLRELLAPAPFLPERALWLGSTLWHLSAVVSPGSRRGVLDDLARLVGPYIEAGVRGPDFGRLWDAASAALQDLDEGLAASPRDDDG